MHCRAHIMTTTGDNSNKQLLAEQPPKTMKHARKSLVAITSCPSSPPAPPTCQLHPSVNQTPLLSPRPRPRHRPTTTQHSPFFGWRCTFLAVLWLCRRWHVDFGLNVLAVVKMWSKVQITVPSAGSNLSCANKWVRYTKSRILNRFLHVLWGASTQPLVTSFLWQFGLYGSCFLKINVQHIWKLSYLRSNTLT